MGINTLKKETIQAALAVMDREILEAYCETFARFYAEEIWEGGTSADEFIRWMIAPSGKIKKDGEILTDRVVRILPLKLPHMMCEDRAEYGDTNRYMDVIVYASGRMEGYGNLAGYLADDYSFAGSEVRYFDSRKEFVEALSDCRKGCS